MCVCSSLNRDVVNPQTSLPTGACAMMWQALLPKTQSALLGSRKIVPSDKVSGNTFPIARPPLCFTCYAVNVFALLWYLETPGFTMGPQCKAHCSHRTAEWIPSQCPTWSCKPWCKDKNWYLCKMLHSLRGGNQLGSGLMRGSQHPGPLWGISMPLAL